MINLDTIKYPVLYKRVDYVIKRFEIEISAQELYNIVVNEYIECEDDPEEATIQDVVEIVDASL